MKTNGRVALVLLAAILSSSCLVRRRVVAGPGKAPNRPMMTASKEDLIQRIHDISDPIRSFLARTSMSVSVTGAKSGEVEDYATISGFLIFQRPDDIRIMGVDPVVGSTIFDMVSTGTRFSVSIPRRNRFIVGSNDSPGHAKNKLENLRPSAFLNALMIYPPNPQTDISLLEDNTSENQAEYILLILRRDLDQVQLTRAIYFDRYTLQVIRQRTFDPAGNILSDAKYASWKDFTGQAFPTDIDIRRPQDGYEVHLGVVSVRVNPTEVTSERFVLQQPSGTQLEQLK